MTANKQSHFMQVSHVLNARQLKKSDTLLEFDGYLEAVHASGLVPSSNLDAIVARDSIRESAEDPSQKLSRTLVESRLLTPWQVHLLRRGYSQGFFLGKYKLLDLIGSGGSGAVYLAEHTLIRRRVAIKVVLPNDDHQSSHAKRFLIESRAVALLDHPNIMRVYHFDTEMDFHYLVMEYLEGSDLSRMVRQEGPLEYPRAMEYIRQAALGLAHAHQADLVHRDVKPANLHATHEGVIKLLDLGLVRMETSRLISITCEFQEALLGTIDYIAPEQVLDSSKVDRRADIYSLGCTLYYLLTGQPPFNEGGMGERLMKHVRDEPEPMSKFRQNMPEELEAVRRRMMAKNPEQRYQTAEEVAAEMHRLLKRSRSSLASEVDVALSSEGEFIELDDSPGSMSSITEVPTHVGLTGLDLGTLSSHEALDLRRVAAALAQRFNNLIQGILGHAELSLLKVPEASDLARSLREISTLAEQGAAFTDRLRIYSGSHPLQPKVIRFDEWLGSLKPTLEALLGPRTGLELICRTDCTVEFDATAIEQVVIELVANAAEAIGASEGHISIVVESTADDSVRLSIADTGTGIAPEHLPMVFEPFFTLKLVGRGLGLSMSRELVGAHGGTLGIALTGEHGTTIEMLLPVTAGQQEEPAEQAAPLILVVDDEPALRNLTQQALESAGFRVLTAKDGQEGVTIFRANVDSIACVLVDKVMPDMLGSDAVVEMRRIRDNVPAILCSAFPATSDEMARAQFVGFLQKPYRMQAMLELIERTLGSST